MPKMTEASGVSRANIYLIPPEQIVVDETENGRRFKRPVEDLMLSIAEKGQLQPVVCRHDESKNWKIVAGYRRLAAIKRINELNPTMEPIRVKVVLRECDDVEALELNAIENAERDDLTPIDCASIIQRLKTFGRTQSEIGKLFHKTDGWVSMTLALLELPKPAQVQVHQGKITAAVAYQAVKAETPQKRDELLAKAESNPAEARQQIAVQKEKKARQKAEARNEAKPKTLREIREFFDTIREDLAVSRKRDGTEELGKVEVLSSAILHWLDGKITDRQMRIRLDSIG